MMRDVHPSDRTRTVRRRLIRPSVTTVAFAGIAGLGNLAVLIALYASGEYSSLGSITALSVLSTVGFTLGFVPLLISAHTRLVSPVVSVLAILAAIAYTDVIGPALGISVVEGSTHLGSYVNSWYVWLSISALVGAVEFAIRRGYGIADHRLRHLPALPLSWGNLVRTIAGFSGLVGVAVLILSLQFGVGSSAVVLVAFVVTTAVVAVPLAALFARGLLSPIVLFALLVPYVLIVEVFATPDSPAYLFLFGPYAIVLAVAWLLEATIRSRFRGWDGGRFAGPRSGR